MKASSTPANPKDLCTKDDVGGVCTLDWNASGGRRGRAFTTVLNQADPNLMRFGPPKVACGPQPGCEWIAFLRNDEAYASAPGTVGAGFLLLLSAVVASPPTPPPAPRWQSILTLMTRAEEIGNSITKGGLRTFEVPDGKVMAAFGCLRADLSGAVIAVVQNMRSRSEGTCDPR